MILIVNITMFNKYIQAFKIIYVACIAALGILETGPKLGLCDDLHMLETISKLYNLIQTHSKVFNKTSN